ncbi:hypothetical protein E5C26_11525 [Serratia proteamaculans]|uniref:hypothetical protein n=1 Tax=Serratia proteamaculans TaxID=28151 RepID=UPI001075FF0F|nr:hypothetical protein [Serratia proteamaculans]TFZ50990.1 hypothetical protein E5C26_11525 [Serratia proteamaculans]
MRELSIMEIEHVSGAGFFDRIGAAFLGALAFTGIGAAKGGVSGGSTGGILGVGVIGAAFTAIYGGLHGMLQGAVYGFVNGWDKTLSVFNGITEQWGDQTVPTPKV